MRMAAALVVLAIGGCTDSASERATTEPTPPVSADDAAATEAELAVTSCGWGNFPGPSRDRSSDGSTTAWLGCEEGTEELVTETFPGPTEESLAAAMDAVFGAFVAVDDGDITVIDLGDGRFQVDLDSAYGHELSEQKVGHGLPGIGAMLDWTIHSNGDLAEVEVTWAGDCDAFANGIVYDGAMCGTFPNS